MDGAVIAFIQRRDRTFVARAGPRAGKSRDCPQCLLWVEAARELVHAAGLCPALSHGYRIKFRLQRRNQLSRCSYFGSIDC